MTMDMIMVIFVMKTISKSKLKAHMLEILRNIEETGEEIIITDRGLPVLRIVQYKEKLPVEKLFGSFTGKVIYSEDINTPTEDEWRAT